jgi:hypothetical protein
MTGSVRHTTSISPALGHDDDPQEIDFAPAEEFEPIEDAVEYESPIANYDHAPR